MSWALGCHVPLLKGISDWAGIDADSDPLTNRVPGDTKVSSKWHTDLFEKGRSERVEFLKPLSQVNYYAKRSKTRYGYVISDKELLCFRRSLSEYEEESLAAMRQRRGTQPPTTPSTPSSSPPFEVVIQNRRPQQFLTPERQPMRPRQDSITSRMSTMSIDSPSIMVSSPADMRSSPSRYTDDDDPDVNEAVIEVAVIPWGEDRPGHLTVNLALFWLHILAAFDIDMQPSYPPLGRELAEDYGQSTVMKLYADH